MTMTTPHDTPMADDELLAKLEEGTEIQRVDVSAVAILNRSEVEAQIDAAHRHPRSVAKFVREAMSLATLTREVASSCIYALPRGGKTIPGPSVRLAEIAASAYGNLHIGARVVDVEEKEIVAQGVAWDLEKNVRVTVETRRRITDSKGKRYNDDMITMTGNAAASIALRNAIFRVVPRAFVDTIYAKARQVAVGDAKTLVQRRQELFDRFIKMGLLPDRVLARLEKKNVDDVGLEDLETLIGLGTAIANGDMNIDAAFPPVITAAGDPADLEAKLRERKAKGGGAKASPPTQAPQGAPAAAPTAQEPARAPATPPVAPQAPGGGNPRDPNACFYCKEIVGADGVDHEDDEGVIHRKHRNCTAFGKGV